MWKYLQVCTYSSQIPLPITSPSVYTIVGRLLVKQLKMVEPLTPPWGTPEDMSCGWGVSPTIITTFFLCAEYDLNQHGVLSLIPIDSSLARAPWCHTRWNAAWMSRKILPCLDEGSNEVRSWVTLAEPKLNFFEQLTVNAKFTWIGNFGIP